MNLSEINYVVLWWGVVGVVGGGGGNDLYIQYWGGRTGKDREGQ